MSKELVISSNRHETRVALLEDDQLVEVYFQRANEYSLAGSIHKGRVTRVLPGMQSAFVDLGLERDTFLYVSDFLEEEHEDIDRVTGDERPPRESNRDRDRDRDRDRERRPAMRPRRNLWPLYRYLLPLKKLPLLQSVLWRPRPQTLRHRSEVRNGLPESRTEARNVEKIATAVDAARAAAVIADADSRSRNTPRWGRLPRP